MPAGAAAAGDAELAAGEDAAASGAAAADADAGGAKAAGGEATAAAADEAKVSGEVPACEAAAGVATAGGEAAANLSLTRLEAIQAEYMADDLPIDLARMRLWTDEQAVKYFESGGEVAPPSEQPDAIGAGARRAAPRLDGVGCGRWW